MTPLAIILILLVSAALAGLLFYTNRQDEKRKSMFEKSEAVIRKHLSTLSRRRNQLLKTDAYGTILVDDWHKEIKYFIKTNILPILDREEKNQFLAEPMALALNKMVEEYAKINPFSQKYDENMSPLEYEHFCAEVLSNGGWDARVTMASRDQGVDVVAEKDGLRIVVQCKLYSRPVGNKAVQEISAAREFEKADYGLVVSNNKYTPAAEQLAKANKIMLLHHTDLSDIDEYLLRASEGGV